MIIVLYDNNLSLYLHFFCKNYQTMGEHKVLVKLGERIKTIRLSKSMTQNQLAMECDFEKASLSRIESGKSNPTIRTLYKLSTALGTSISDFFTE
ncbi:helix-turn-helix domain-containing protein [Ferruginibacter sp. SUN106]|uniref:helix-turn-helix domain-containing protein n=1 Tax=Ferruginibacter sp. SUN106 TaxID=2978348 RepID=UPI003D35C697